MKKRQDNSVVPNIKPAPKHLAKLEQELWRLVVSENKFVGPASFSLLHVALESHQRARECRETIEKDGFTFRDRVGGIKPHPLISAERDARAAYISGLKRFNLDLLGANL